MSTVAHLDCFGVSHVGRKRRANEDQFLIADLHHSLTVRASSAAHQFTPATNDHCDRHLFVVADGMGGHAAGQRASGLAIDTLEQFLNKQLPWPARDGKCLDVEPCTALVNSLIACHQQILADTVEHPQRAGMGTTMTVAMVMWPWTYIAHVGDSRCYLLRGSQLRQMTTDHTVAFQLVQRGVLTPEIARQSSLNRILWNVLGGSQEATLEPETQAFRAEVGDTLLICSDGLTAHVTDEEIQRVLGETASAADASQLLIKLANEGGGTDNITAVVARFCTNSTPLSAAKVNHRREPSHSTIHPNSPLPILPLQVDQNRLNNSVPEVLQ